MTVSTVQAAASAIQSNNMDKLSPIQQELLRRADSIYDGIAATVNKATTFAGEQIPDIAFQYVAWGRGYLTAYMIIALVLFVSGLWLAWRIGFFNSRKLRDDYQGDWHGARIMSCIGGIIIMGIGFIVMLNNLKEFIMVWFAPKIWLIQEIVHLVKQAT